MAGAPDINELIARSKPITAEDAKLLLQGARPPTEEDFERDDEFYPWSQLADELARAWNKNLPTFGVIEAIRRLPLSLSPDIYCAIWSAAIFGDDAIALCRAVGRAKGVKRQATTGCEIVEYELPDGIKQEIERWGKIYLERKDEIEGMLAELQVLDEWFAVVNLARKECWEYNQTPEEQDSSMNDRAKYPYRIGGGIQLHALMQARYGNLDDCPYNRWLCLAWYVGEVGAW